MQHNNQQVANCMNSRHLFGSPELSDAANASGQQILKLFHSSHLLNVRCFFYWTRCYKEIAQSQQEVAKKHNRKLPFGRRLSMWKSKICIKTITEKKQE